MVWRRDKKTNLKKKKEVIQGGRKRANMINFK